MQGVKTRLPVGQPSAYPLHNIDVSLGKNSKEPRIRCCLSVSDLYQTSKVHTRLGVSIR